MAEPARNISSASQSSSSLGRANLSLIQGGKSSTTKKNQNEPKLHPLSQMALARDLEEQQARDRMGGDGDSNVSDDTLKTESSENEGGSVLDLEPQSYTTRESTPEKSEANRQRQLARTGARFLHPDAKALSDDESESMQQSGSRRGSNRQPIRSEQQAQSQFAEQVLSDRMQASLQRREAQNDVAEMSQEVVEAQETAQETRRLYALITKIIELESVILAIWVIIALNIEMWNILVFKKKLPATMNNALNKIGLNIDVDPAHPYTKMNMIVVGLALLVDGIIGLFVMIQLAVMLFVVYLIYQAFSVLGLVGISG